MGKGQGRKEETETPVHLSYQPLRILLAGDPSWLSSAMSHQKGPWARVIDQSPWKPETRVRSKSSSPGFPASCSLPGRPFLNKISCILGRRDSRAVHFPVLDRRPLRLRAFSLPAAPLQDSQTTSPLLDTSFFPPEPPPQMRDLSHLAQPSFPSAGLSPPTQPLFKTATFLGEVISITWGGVISQLLGEGYILIA